MSLRKPWEGAARCELKSGELLVFWWIFHTVYMKADDIWDGYFWACLCMTDHTEFFVINNPTFNVFVDKHTESLLISKRCAL